jgi:transcriptional regulator with XRE-family HTH domain
LGDSLLNNKSTIHISKTKLKTVFRREREKLGCTKQELIYMLQGRIGKTTLSKIEYGKRSSYREDILMELSKLFNIPINDFLNEISLAKYHNKQNNVTIKPFKADYRPLFNSPYSIHFASINDLNWIVALEKLLYPDLISNSFERYKSWLLKNPYCITVIKDKFQKNCGYFALLPVKEEIYLKMVTGEIYDSEIEQDDLYSIEEKNKVQYLYNASIIVINEEYDFNAFALQTYLDNLEFVFSSVSSLSNDLILFTILGKKGDELIVSQYRFTKIPLPVNSKSKFEVYYIPIKQLFHNIEIN